MLERSCRRTCTVWFSSVLLGDITDLAIWKLSMISVKIHFHFIYIPPGVVGGEKSTACAYTLHTCESDRTNLLSGMHGEICPKLAYELNFGYCLKHKQVIIKYCIFHSAVAGTWSQWHKSVKQHTRTTFGFWPNILLYPKLQHGWWTRAHTEVTNAFSTALLLKRVISHDHASPLLLNKSVKPMF